MGNAYKVTGDFMGTLKERIREIEKNEITVALMECNWIMAQAARSLGITERMIGYKIKKYGIRKEGRLLGIKDNWESSQVDELNKTYKKED